MTKSIEAESSVELEEAAYLVRSRGRGRVRVRVRNGRLGLGQGESSVGAKAVTVETARKPSAPPPPRVQ